MPQATKSIFDGLTDGGRPLVTPRASPFEGLLDGGKPLVAPRAEPDILDQSLADFTTSGPTVSALAGYRGAPANPSDIASPVNGDILRPPPPTFGETGKQAARSVGQTLASFVTTPLRLTDLAGAALLRATEPGGFELPPEKMPLSRFAKYAETLVNDVLPEEQKRAKGTFLGDVLPSGLASMGTMMAGGGALSAATGLPGLASAAAIGSGLGAVEGYKRAREKGASVETALKASGLSGLVGTTEGVPLGKMIDRLTGGMASKGVKEAVRLALGEAGEETIQNTMQQIGDNYVAKALYDPSQDVLEGADQAFTSGGIVGFIASIGASMLGAKARRRAGYSKEAVAEGANQYAQTVESKAGAQVSGQTMEALGAPQPPPTRLSATPAAPDVANIAGDSTAQAFAKANPDLARTLALQPELSRADAAAMGVERSNKKQRAALHDQLKAAVAELDKPSVASATPASPIPIDQKGATNEGQAQAEAPQAEALLSEPAARAEQPPPGAAETNPAADEAARQARFSQYANIKRPGQKGFKSNENRSLMMRAEADVEYQKYLADRKAAETKERRSFASQQAAETRRSAPSARAEAEALASRGAETAESIPKTPLHLLPDPVKEAIQYQAGRMLNESTSAKTKAALQKIIDDEGRDVGSDVEKHKARVIDRLLGDTQTVHQRLGWQPNDSDPFFESYLSAGPEDRPKIVREWLDDLERRGDVSFPGGGEENPYLFAEKNLAGEWMDPAKDEGRSDPTMRVDKPKPAESAKLEDARDAKIRARYGAGEGTPQMFDESPPGEASAENADAARRERDLSEKQSLGIVPAFLRPVKKVDVPKSVQHPNPVVEGRIRAKRGRPTPKVIDQIRGVADALWKSSTRVHAEIPNSEPFDAAREHFRMFKNIPTVASDETARRVATMVDGLTPEDLLVFERKVLADNMASPMNADKLLMYGFKDRAEVDSYKQQVDAEVAENQAVKKAVDIRRQTNRALVQDMVKYDLLPKEALANVDDYMHQDVFERELINRVGGGRNPRQIKRSFQKGRVKGEEGRSPEHDPNSNFVESEIKWQTEARIELEKAKWIERLARLEKSDDLIAQLKKEAEAAGVEDWEDMLKDHPELSAWAAKEGNLFYPAWSVDDKIAEGIMVRGMEMVDNDALRKVLAMGGKGKTYVFRNEVASQLESMKKPTPTGPISAAADWAMKAWKWRVLLGPDRAIGYMVRNITGDAEPVLAIAPGVSKYMGRAAKDVRSYYLKGDLAMSPELRASRDNGVIDASMTETEIPKVGELPIIRRVTGQELGLAKTYADVVKRVNSAREGATRHAAFLYFKDDIAKNGKPSTYAGSIPHEVDNVLAEFGADAAAAKLSRELLGDYGKLTVMGEWMRRKAVPFWSFQELNLRRWPKLVKNAMKEGGRRGAAKAGVAGGIALAAFNLAMLAKFKALSWLWNNIFFPKEEEESSLATRTNDHIQLGRNPDGSIRVFRNVGSSSDFLEWMGLNSAANLMPQYLDGKIGAEQVLKGMRDEILQKVVGGIRPDLKIVPELLAGQSYFPNPMKPRTVPRDEIAADALGMGDWYAMVRKYALGDGTSIRPGMGDRWLGFAIEHPMRNALSEIHDRIGMFLESKNLGNDDSYGLSKSRLMRRAVENRDYDAFVAAKRQYLKDGGSFKSFKQSIARLDPLTRVKNGPLEKEFVERFLDESDRRKLTMARDWAHSLRDGMLSWWKQAESENNP